MYNGDGEEFKTKEEKRGEKIVMIYDTVRLVLFIVLMLLIGVGLARAQDTNDSLAEKLKYSPQVHGMIRGKYEYEKDMDGGRFEVRNARISLSNSLTRRSEYKIEVDLCDESSIKMKDAWVRLTPFQNFRISVGQQRMPFSIDAHRNPTAQYFANRSFIAKQVGDMRDVGVIVGYTFNNDNRDVVIWDGGIFNGSNIDNQKTAWHSDLNYSSRIQFFPVKGLCLVPSIQHTAIADRKVHYTSLDFGGYYDYANCHVEVEYLHKHYLKDAFQDCDAFDAMAIYKIPFEKKDSFIQAISCLLRYDSMGDHTDGKSGFETDQAGNATTKLVMTDVQRQRLTFGLTFSVRNKFFPTDLRLNYEKYFYDNIASAKQSELSKLVAELMVKF